MKWSYYNYLFEGEGKYFIYNSLSNSFAKLDTVTYQKLNALKEVFDIQSIDEDLRQKLLEMKVLVEDDRDELNKIKFITQRKRFYDKHLGLTINPTLHCNFACPYCFEENHPNIYMSEQVENDIIQYIKGHKSVKTLSVTWFGGEPLLAFERIVSLTNKIKELGLIYKAGMITNGYLFNEQIVSQLSSLCIKTIQITVDGNEQTHNSRRCLKSGKGTFKRIMDNIDLLQKKTPEIRIAIRVNIDETNKNDFIELYDFFKKKNYPNLKVSPAFVEDTSGCNVDDCIFNAERKRQFVLTMKIDHGIDCTQFYPSSSRYECSVRNPNIVAIGPSGELYKCWNDIGKKECVVGYLNGKIENEKLLIRYLNAADPFEDEECRKCLLLPVCGGGCPYMRIKRDYENKEFELCSLLKHNLNEFLLIHYKNKMACLNK